jgi:PhzF family phenazine biosynthesis protein
MELKMQIIDAFTDVLFKGNSAAVIITDDWLSDELMQSIAVENNLSETAFVKKLCADKVEIRWFSPLIEIDFCGHATLAAAFVLFSENDSLNTLSFFAEAIGHFDVTSTEDGYIEMNFPDRSPVLVQDIPKSLLEGLSITPVEVLLSEQAYFVVYTDEVDVSSVEYNSELLKKLAPHDVVVTAKASKSDHYDFVSRYFWPASGGDEDPVTGSIHAGLTPYWADKLNKTTLRAYQASKRGGLLKCRFESNPKGNRVLISGKAVKYLTGVITVAD